MLPCCQSLKSSLIPEIILTYIFPATDNNHLLNRTERRLRKQCIYFYWGKVCKARCVTPETQATRTSRPMTASTLPTFPAMPPAPDTTGVCIMDIGIIIIIILSFSTRLRVGDNHGRASVPKGQTRGEI